MWGALVKAPHKGQQTAGPYLAGSGNKHSMHSNNLTGFVCFIGAMGFARVHVPRVKFASVLLYSRVI